MSVDIADIASGLNARRIGPGRYLARCPAHDDKTPSLSLTERNGKVLVHCFTGCSQKSVIEALRALGLWPEPKPRGHSPRLAADPEFRGDLHLAKYWRFSLLALADKTLEAMDDTDPARLDVTEYAKEVRTAGKYYLTALFRDHRIKYPDMTVAMIQIAQRHAANQQRRLVDWIDRGCNGTF